ncbi:MAG: hypothetical protein F6K31_23580 [Symploca sp. SIO2G7]|nr:hypothetical protein [Symploca sp. SIO2G7]
MSNLDLTQFIGSTSQPVGTQLAYQIDGSVVPGSKAVFKTISPSSLVLEGSFSIEGLQIMDGDLEIIDRGDGSTVTVGYNLQDGTPFVTATFQYVVDSSFPRLNLTRQAFEIHQKNIESHHAAFLSMFMMIKTAYIQPVPDGENSDTFLSATSDLNILTIATTLVPSG